MGQIDPALPLVGLNTCVIHEPLKGQWKVKIPIQNQTRHTIHRFLFLIPPGSVDENAKNVYVNPS